MAQNAKFVKSSKITNYMDSITICVCFHCKALFISSFKMNCVNQKLFYELAIFLYLIVG